MTTFNRRSTAEQVSSGIDLHGKNALVTGANTGLGRETTRVLALRGATVTMACRDQHKAEATRQAILDAAKGAINPEQLDILVLDLNNLQHIRTAATNYNRWQRPLHILVNNAGIMIPMERRTDDGFEAHLGINHLGHYLFTRLILERLQAAEGARVVMVASAAMAMATQTERFEDLNWQQRKFGGFKSYGDSKLMNLMFARELTRRYADQGIVANALHPGIIKTDLAREQSALFLILGLLAIPWMRPVEQGAATQVFLATAPEYGSKGGCYLIDCQEREPEYKLALNDSACQKLWDISAELTGLTS